MCMDSEVGISKLQLFPDSTLAAPEYRARSIHSRMSGAQSHCQCYMSLST